MFESFAMIGGDSSGVRALQSARKKYQQENIRPPVTNVRPKKLRNDAENNAAAAAVGSSNSK